MAKVAIIGSGFIGRAWAISFARAGHEAALWDAASGAPADALTYIESLLPDLKANDLLNGATPLEIRGRIQVAATLEAAVAGAVHVQENTPENLDLKREIFARLDAVAEPDAVLASSTSALLPSRFTEGLAGRARCMVVHPINPPYLIPAAEVVPAPWTDANAIKRTAEFLRAAGHAPIVMKREVGLRDGLALRWSFMGPFETIDLNAPAGVRDYVARYESIYSAMFPSMQRRAAWAGSVLDVIEAERRARTPAEKLPERQLWRDRRLMALARHKRLADRDIGN